MGRKFFPTSVLKQGGETPELMISTEDVDRDGDRLLASGALLDNYRKNPAVLYAHNHREVPIGRATSVRAITGRGVAAGWRWLEGDPLAERVRNAWDQGVLNAASVGFLPREWRPNDEGGFDYTRWELLEFSIVPIPANPEAVRTLKALGLSPQAGSLGGSSGIRLPAGVTFEEARRGLSAWISEELRAARHQRAVLREAATEAVREAVDDALRRSGIG